GAVRADQAENLALLDPERYVVDRGEAANTLHQPFYRQHASCSALLAAERGSLRQGQHGLALRLTLRPHHVGLVVDILDDHRERALVLSGHLRAFAVEFDAEAEHGAAFGNVDLQRRLAQGIGIDAAIFLDGTWQYIGE